MLFLILYKLCIEMTSPPQSFIITFFWPFVGIFISLGFIIEHYDTVTDSFVYWIKRKLKERKSKKQKPTEENDDE